MSKIRMTGELRTDYDCEAQGLPAERWAEAVFNIDGEELVLEVSVEDSVIVALMAGEDQDFVLGISIKSGQFPSDSVALVLGHRVFRLIEIIARHKADMTINLPGLPARAKVELVSAGRQRGVVVAES